MKDGRSCRAPGQGKYADISGMEQACDDLYPIVGGTYITPQGGEDQGAACDFTCPEEKVKKADSRRCDDPLLGTYVLTNIQYNCWAPDSDSSTNAADESVAELSRRGGTAWASDQSGVRTAAACKLATCAGTNKALNTAKTACDCVPSHHPDGTDGINCVSNTRDCNPAPNNGKGKQVWGGTAWRTCQITHCDGGHWKSGRACVAVTGRYVSPKKNMARIACAGSEIPNPSKTTCTNCPNDQHTENNISCISNIHTGSTCKTGNLPSQASQTTAVKQTWSGGSWGACEATACKNGYAVSNGVCTATLCRPGQTQLVAISNGERKQVCANNGNSWVNQEITQCDADHYEHGNACVAVGNGFYSTSTSKSRTACTTPDNFGSWTSAGGGRDNCTFTCTPSHHPNGRSCVSNTQSCYVSGSRTAQKTWTSGSWSRCKATGCLSSDTLYEGACYARSKSCSLNELPDNAASGTKTYDADGVYHTCSVTCSTGYGFDANGRDGRECALLVPSVTSVVVQGLKDIGDGIMATKKYNPNIKITATGVTHYYLTHDASFTPTGITGSTEGSRRWLTRKPTKYTFPKTDGIYTLYLWVADVEGVVSASSTASASFTLDVTAPIVEFAQNPALKSFGEKTFVLDITDTTPIKEYVYKHTDCDRHSWCSKGSQNSYCTHKTFSGPSLELGRLFKNALNTANCIEFKVKDALGQTTTKKYKWDSMNCQPGTTQETGHSVPMENG